MQKVFFDNETANGIADPETYNRSDNEKGDVHVDHTSPPEEPTSGFGEMCPTVGRMRLVPIRTAYREFPGVFFYIKFYRADFFFFP